MLKCCSCTDYVFYYLSSKSDSMSYCSFSSAISAPVKRLTAMELLFSVICSSSTESLERVVTSMIFLSAVSASFLASCNDSSGL